MDGRPVADYQGKRIVVTGASSGIGEAIALELSRRGARPVLVGRNIEKLRAAASQLGLPDDFVLPLDLKDHSTILPGIMSLSQKIAQYLRSLSCGRNSRYRTSVRARWTRFRQCWM
jgi:NADP-dependent 3-hydroxy acid dehydrogenase YdfG